jgi:hypothetical protein
VNVMNSIPTLPTHFLRHFSRISATSSIPFKSLEELPPLSVPPFSTILGFFGPSFVDPLCPEKGDQFKMVRFCSSLVERPALFICRFSRIYK